MASASFTQEEKAAAKTTGEVLVIFAANGKDSPPDFPFREFEISGSIPPAMAAEACLWFAEFMRRASVARVAQAGEATAAGK